MKVLLRKTDVGAHVDAMDGTDCQVIQAHLYELPGLLGQVSINKAAPTTSEWPHAFAWTPWTKGTPEICHQILDTVCEWMKKYATSVETMADGNILIDWAHPDSVW